MGEVTLLLPIPSRQKMFIFGSNCLPNQMCPQLNKPFSLQLVVQLTENDHGQSHQAASAKDDSVVLVLHVLIDRLNKAVSELSGNTGTVISAVCMSSAITLNDTFCPARAITEVVSCAVL